MKRLIEIEMSLLALETYEFEAYVEEINEILNCIESDVSYDEAPDLSSNDLEYLLESMCARTTDEPQPTRSIERFIYGASPDFQKIRKKIRAILIEKRNLQ